MLKAFGADPLTTDMAENSVQQLNWIKNKNSFHEQVLVSSWKKSIIHFFPI